MANNPLDVRRTLRRLSAEARRGLLVHLNVLGVDWDAVPEGSIEPLLAAVAALGAAEQHQVLVALGQVATIFDAPNGGELLVQVAGAVDAQFADRLAEVPGAADRGAMAIINLPTVVEQTAALCRYTLLQGTQFWSSRNSLPSLQIEPTEELRDSLAAEMSAHFNRTKFCGKHWLPELVRLPDGSLCFHAWFSSLPDASIGFRNGEILSQGFQTAFEVCSIYRPSSGVLETVVKGGRRVRDPLDQIFCRRVLNHDLRIDRPVRPTYRLDHLLEEGRRLPIEAGLPARNPRIVLCRYERLDRSGRQYEFVLPPETTQEEFQQHIDEICRGGSTSRAMLRVRRIVFMLEIEHEGRWEDYEISVSMPSYHRCNESEEVRAIVKRFLVLAGVAGG